MKAFKRAVSAALALFFLFSLSACSSGPESVVATVDGVPVYRWEVDYLYDKNYNFMVAQSGIDTSDEEQVQSIKENYLEQLITDTAMNLYAEEQGYGLTDEEKAEVDAEYQKIRTDAIAKYAEDHDGDTAKGEEDYLAYLKEQHLTEDYLLQNMYNNKMREKMSDDLYASVTSTDDAVEDYYNTEVESDKELYTNNYTKYESDNASDSYTVMYTPADYVRFKQIYIALPQENLEQMQELAKQIGIDQSQLAVLTKQKGDSDYTVYRLKKEIEANQAEFDSLKQQGLDAVRSEAEEAFNRVKAGEDFDSLVTEYGDDEGMKSAPYRDLGYLCCAYSTSFYEEVQSAALALANIGDTSDLIETEGGFYILELVAKIPEGPREMTDDLRTFIETALSLPSKQEIYNETAQKALEGRTIVRYTDRLK